jgi:YHS domain-containing protein
MAVDPVCGMEVDESTVKHTAQYNQTTYYFCAPGFKKAFEADPQQYLDPAHTPSTREHTPET